MDNAILSGDSIIAVEVELVPSYKINDVIMMLMLNCHEGEQINVWYNQ